MKYVTKIFSRSICAFLVALILCSSLSSGMVQAFAGDPQAPYDPEGMEGLLADTAWYDPNALACGTSTGVTELHGKDNIEKSLNFFLSKGLTIVQAAGIVGNLRQESGTMINPGSNNTAANASSIRPDSIIPGETFLGGGIAQWEDYAGTPTRWTGSSGLLNYVAGKGDFAGAPKGDGTNWRDLAVQLDFLWGELSGTFPNNKQSGLEQVKAATTVEAATIAFEVEFERAGTPNMPRRIELAQEVYVTYGPTAAASLSSCAGKVNVDGYAFPLEPQTKKSYGAFPGCVQNGRVISYTDRYGSRSDIRYCHHDSSPAFDLMDGDGGSKVYALTGGTVIRADSCYSISGACVPGCSSFQFRANNGEDRFFYWHGHLKGLQVRAGQNVDVGHVMATTATTDFGWRCWGGGPHLHIDRGCVNPNNNEPQDGGYDNCREPGFLADMLKIWEGL